MDIYKTPILLKGYHPDHNPAKVYKTAKEPIGTSTGYTKPGYKPPAPDAIKRWTDSGGWVGHLVPKGCHVLDIEDPAKITLVRGLCRQKGITPPINKTNNGLQFIFSTNGCRPIPGASTRFCQMGFPVTDRSAGKNYVILPPTNGRTFENEDCLSDPPVILEELLPAQNNIRDTRRALAWALGDAHRKGQLAGYDDLDGGFMALLISCSIPKKSILETFQIVFLNDYDERRTLAMLQRTMERTATVQPLRGIGSLIQSLKDKDLDSIVALVTKLERMAIPIDKQPDTATTELKIINAADWLQTDPPAPDQILADTFDAGDKVAIIGSSKLRKSFFLLQMDISLAAGRDFLTWRITKPRRVLHCQFEIKDLHFHRRLKRMARAMGITADDLGDRLQIINARGLGISGPEGVERIQKIAMGFHPEVISFDPLYKLTTGIENDAQDMKIILDAFDKLAEQTGAAPIYIHHDAKGSPGDRDIRDRGAGSNVLGRDYDACITLTAHSQDPEAAVVEILLRNYRPQEPFTIIWAEDESGAYRFEERPDIIPEKKTSKTKSQPPALSIYLPAAASILGDEEMEMGPFKTSFKEQTALSDHRIRDFLAWATSGGKPHLLTREERGRGIYKKLIKAAEEVGCGG